MVNIHEFFQPYELSKYDKEHIEEIICGEGDWFSARLIRLIKKADQHNRLRLYMGFPEAVEAVEQWENKDD